MKETRLYQSLRFPAIILAIMWGVQVVQTVTGISFAKLGILPRNFDGLWGILSSPFVHSSKDFLHIISNSPPLFVSMAMILFFFPRVAYRSFLFIWILTGALVWAFAGSAFHIGASGVVYGLVSFIFWNGVFRRNLKSIVLSLIIILLYSGMFLGILPNQPGISWESHLLGGLVGIIASFLFRHQIEITDEEPILLEEADEEYY
ncbi:MAG: rhomboid family intramembrane serine protease, partial [Saprospiraceae bacterium]|nr:rhomboid family intramembrane serine protease [Saprospiraceae bacterium]